MRSLRQTLLASALLPLMFAGGLSADLLPPETDVERAIDHYIETALAEASVSPAPQASGANLMRRLTLDLAGRIPAVIEVKQFAASDSPNRDELVDRLINSPDYADYMAARFDWFIMGGNGGIAKYLNDAFIENRAWDDIFRDILLADLNGLPDTMEFLKRRVKDTDQLTNEISVKFLGVNISCAKCHDHPLVPEWTQDHFYGMKSFFARTFDNGGFVAERNYGLVKYKTTEGDDRQAKLMFLTGRTVVDVDLTEPSKSERKKLDRLFAESKKKKEQPPPPNLSLRQILVDVALEEGQNHFFAKAIVNRLWHQFFGQGLVDPLDQMHEENPPSHPELLDWLARDLVAHGYDLRRLIRGLVLSKAYSRSSLWEHEEQPPAYLFAAAIPRPLTPTQLARSLSLATADQEQLSRVANPGDLEATISELASKKHAKLFAQPGENFQVPASEALWFTNSQEFERDYLTSSYVTRLRASSDAREVIDMAYWTILSRAPTEEELQLLEAYLARRMDRPEQAYRQLIWSLICSSEFRFNY